MVGNGYWGKNLVRNFHALGALKWVCDSRPEALQEAKENFDVATCSRLTTLLEDPEVQGHSNRCARRATLRDSERMPSRRQGCLCRETSVAQGDRRTGVSGNRGSERPDPDGWTHPSVSPRNLKLKELIDSGSLGRIEYIYSSRLNWGKFRSEENILWSFAPHDISAILYLLNEVPISVNCQRRHPISTRKSMTRH